MFLVHTYLRPPNSKHAHRKSLIGKAPSQEAIGLQGDEGSCGGFSPCGVAKKARSKS
jgi:hypothetical protein